MFEVGFTELLVIFVLALVVLGPEKLPRLAQQVGRWIGRARAMARQFREQLEDEVNLADMKKWQETSSKSTSEPASSTPQSDATSAGPTSPADTGAQAHSTAQPDSAQSAPHGSETAAATPETGAAVGTPEHSAAGPGHYAGPPPEPEANVYQPPAYASARGASAANGSTPHPASSDAAHAVESAPAATPSTSTASQDPAPASDERPARPGDVITHTHERGI